MEFSPSHFSHVVSFYLSLLEERGKVLLNGKESVDLGIWLDEHLLWLLNTFLRIKEELKGTEKILEITKAIKIVMYKT